MEITEINSALHSDGIAEALSNAKTMTDKEFEVAYKATKKQYLASVNCVDSLYHTITELEADAIGEELSDMIEILKVSFDDLSSYLERLHMARYWSEDSD